MNVRPTAVAGRFFPSAPDELCSLVDTCLREGEQPEHGGVPKAIVAPHAGFIFSGPIAGSAFGTLVAARERIERVIVIGPSHHVAFDGISISGFDAFRTPLGDVPVDIEARDRLLELDEVSTFEPAHEPEHSIETHLPFLQRALGTFQLVPLVTGRVDRQTVSKALEAIWGGEETVISVSSDLSHFLDHETATRRDRETSRAIVEHRPEDIGPRDACGATAINGLLHSAADRQLDTEAFDLRNSGDTRGDKGRVVGYGAYAFWEAT